MKYGLILVIMSLFFVESFSQSKAENILFDMINKYRFNKNIHYLKWDNLVYNVAIDQTKYMSLTNNCTHDQQPETDHFSNFDMNLFRQKFKRHGIDTDLYTVGENCFIGYDIDTLNLSQIAKKVFDGWIKSPPHHKMLLDIDYRKCALSILIDHNNVYSSFNCRD